MLTPGQPTPGLTYPPASLHSYPPASGPGSSEDSPPGSTPLGLARTRWYRNINLLCMRTTPLRPRLSSRLTLADEPSPGTLGIRRRVPPPSFATHACILTRPRSTTAHAAASQLRSTLPYPSRHKRNGRSFGFLLEPRYIVGAGPLDQWSYYALFQGWLASKPTSWLSWAIPHPLPLSRKFGP